ncbi:MULTISPECIES: Hsp20/alpha crystallin family protein [unclassified Anabaena]|jgi:HSP20 family protein|uniref:Hsp20/alpha crystallin family protein n=1 Tax=unclassified Anabaena TaxID=2619674 RepID=UPI0014467DE2|nr:MULTISPECIES: Hsp20/alpha crystallin family protein [unclassified Anabaena]MTJ08279.1 Hsp20/alpha crystallin family protein [Anabaena sp. UHCC 0204]MTJ51625.1 Hsp20/alpha crystallin family protein [Anabaena sp. UHCC 0253]
MALIRWEPFREIERWDPFSEMGVLRRQMDRLFEQLLPTNGDQREGITFIPAAEISEADGNLNLKVEIPGLDAKDINLEVTPESVFISGERKSETKTEEEGTTRSEFRYGRFERVIALPTVVENDKVEADYKDGILRLTIPKAEEGRHKAVKIPLG